MPKVTLEISDNFERLAWKLVRITYGPDATQTDFERFLASLLEVSVAREVVRIGKGQRVDARPKRDQ